MRSGDSGFVLLDALTALFVLTVGIIAVVMALGGLLRGTERLEGNVVKLLGEEKQRYEAWYVITDSDSAFRDRNDKFGDSDDE